jgi:SSS family solute:Na+ symporter
VIAALTIASDILVGGLMVAVLGGMLWRRATGRGAIASIFAGIAGTLGTMLVLRDLYANLPIYIGLVASLLVFVIFSLLDKPTPAAVMSLWGRARACQIADAVVAAALSLPEQAST